MTQNKVNLRPVKKTDYSFLYELLTERDPRANISHKKIPTFAQHIKFVESKPYSKWYIIEYDGTKVGSAYLSKQDEIGLFIKKNLQRKNLGKQALKILLKKNPRNRYLANISPKNKKSIKFFQKNGFKLIQYTFELETKNKK